MPRRLKRDALDVLLEEYERLCLKASIGTGFVRPAISEEEIQRRLDRLETYMTQAAKAGRYN